MLVNFSRRNNVCLLKEPCLIMLSVPNLWQLHMPLKVEVKVMICDMSNAFLVNSSDMSLVVTVRSFVIIANNRVISSLPLQAIQLAFPPLVHRVVVLYILK